MNMIKESFLTVSGFYKPKVSNKERNDNIFITNSMSEMSHFELETANVLEIHRQIFGKEYDVKIEDEAPETGTG